MQTYLLLETCKQDVEHVSSLSAGFVMWKILKIHHLTDVGSRSPSTSMPELSLTSESPRMTRESRPVTRTTFDSIISSLLAWFSQSYYTCDCTPSLTIESSIPIFCPRVLQCSTRTIVSKFVIPHCHLLTATNSLDQSKTWCCNSLVQ